MPTASRHRYQRDHNKRSAVDPELRPYRDWQLTALFYAAVHHVEAVLAHRHRQHSADHADRFWRVRRYWPAAYASLQVLYRRSRWARYDCGAVSPVDVQEATARLARIEQVVR